MRPRARGDPPKHDVDEERSPRPSATRSRVSPHRVPLLELSLRRAEAVRDVPASRGVNPRQMLVEGIGPDRPIADNEAPEGRAANRRVELHIDLPARS